MTDTPLVERLRGLIERLEKLTGPDQHVDAEIESFVMWGLHSEWENAGGGYERHKVTGKQRTFDLWSRVTPPYTASLDAAVALVERVLPGWKWGCHFHNRNPALRRGYVVKPSPLRPMPIDGEHVNTAIALLIATLRALSQEPSHG